MIVYYDKNYRFYEFFNESNGFTLRSNVFENDVETEKTPTCRSYPDHLDIGIMGHCSSAGFCRNAGVDCYQNASNKSHANMSLENYKTIMDESKGKVFQVALGGAGDPNKHEHFEEILRCTRKSMIVPNLTTSGYNITDDEVSCIKKYCGAVAVSFYSTLNSNDEETCIDTIETIEKFVEANCVTNVHYVLHKDNIDEVCHRIEKRLFPIGINAIIFLLYKPVGQGKKHKMLTASDDSYRKLFETISQNSGYYKYGFDTCQTPAVRRYCDSVSDRSFDFCEAGRFSMYIDSQMNAFPCSFAIEKNEFSKSLSNNSITNVWNSKEFNEFRLQKDNLCANCCDSNCFNCPLQLGINVCGQNISH